MASGRPLKTEERNELGGMLRGMAVTLDRLVYPKLRETQHASKARELSLVLGQLVNEVLGQGPVEGATEKGPDAIAVDWLNKCGSAAHNLGGEIKLSSRDLWAAAAMLEGRPAVVVFPGGGSVDGEGMGGAAAVDDTGDTPVVPEQVPEDAPEVVVHTPSDG